jgi:prolyl 4-hydroxylase
MANPAPNLANRADALAARGEVDQAVRLLTGPAAANDRDALALLAEWRLGGSLIRRDLKAARELFGRSAQLGHDQAVSIHEAFLAGGIGGPRDWAGALASLRRRAGKSREASAELELLEAMNLSADGEPLPLPEQESLSEQPRASCIRGLLSAAECAFLAERAKPRLGPSVVIDPRSGRQLLNPIRTSDGMSFPYVAETPAIHALNRRIAAASGTQTAQGEPLQVLRYRPGQEYRTHSDAVTGEPNQRVLTVLVYLNRGYEGGETRFVRTGLTFKGEPGDALLFWNVDREGRPDPLAAHAGLPVRSGEKLIASRWIRAAPFVFPPPRPALDV